MRVVLLTNRFPPRWLAGTEIATLEIARSLVNKGHEVHVITSLDKGLPDNPDQYKGLKIHRIPSLDFGFLGIILFWARVFIKINEISPDIIHSQGLSIAMPAVISKFILRKPFVVRGEGSDVYVPWMISPFLSKFASELIVRKADSTIALTDEMKSHIAEMHGNDILVIPNGVNLAIFKIERHITAVEGSKTLLFVGTLRAVKGVEYLIEAMRIIVESIPQTKLLIVGDGEDRHKLEVLTRQYGLEHQIHFTGRIEHEDIPRVMSSSDIFVLPSLSEGSPLVISEAMAAGLPIVATLTRGMKEIIRDGENGYLVDPANPRELADRILELLRDDKMSREIAEHNRRRAACLSWDLITDQFVSIYQKALERN